MAEAGGTGWLGDAASELAIGVVVGVVLGYVGGWLLGQADRRSWTSAVSRQLFVLALAGACYLVSVGVGGNGFIAAFVGGLAFGRGSGGREHEAVRFTELQGSLLAIGLWIAFGLSIAGRMSSDLWDPAAIVYAALSLTVIRMVPVAIALLGVGFDRSTVAFMGWFGPRGIASVVFLDRRPRGPRRGGHRAGSVQRGGRLDGRPVGDPARPVRRSAGRPVRAPCGDPPTRLPGVGG